jgi:hypothetical protein
VRHDDQVEDAGEQSVAAALGVRVTAPPGTRLAERTVLDEVTRPHATLSPSSQYTPGQRSAAQHLVDIHDHLRTELEEIRALVKRVVTDALSPAAARSQLNVMTMRQHSWALGAYCQSYCRLVTGHHSLEDMAMLPHLRRAEPELSPVVDRLEAEHQVIHQVLEELDRALVRFVDDADRGEELRQAVDLLTDTLLSHLSYEEHQLVEPLARHGFGFG